MHGESFQIMCVFQAPRSTKVHVKSTLGSADCSFMLMSVHNVHCYPGVPSLLRTIFQSHKVEQRAQYIVEKYVLVELCSPL